MIADCAMPFEDFFQVLIFCATRRMAIQSANQLVKTVGERNESYIMGGEQQKALATAVSKCKNQSLAELLRHGVGDYPRS
jgi:replicative superfamily II helicase